MAQLTTWTNHTRHERILKSPAPRRLPVGFMNTERVIDRKTEVCRLQDIYATATSKAPENPRKQRPAIREGIAASNFP